MIYTNPPKPSHSLSQNTSKPFNADLRAEITAWKALVWAYKLECVRAAIAGGEGPAGFRLPGYASAVLVEGSASWSINARLNAHEDAFAIAAALMEQVPVESRVCVEQAAEAGVLPAWGVEPQPLRVVPMMKETAWGPKPVMLYPMKGRKEPYLCQIEYQGFSAKEIMRMKERAVDVWLDLVHLLDTIMRLPLVKWKVLELGVARYPWDVKQIA
jgi:hypothetical protein